MFSEVTALLGEPQFHWSDPAPWNDLERELDTDFPEDFREVVNAYGSVAINGQLYLKHPARHLLHNLGAEIKADLELWSDEDMVEYLPSRAGGNPGELIPAAWAATGETVFLRVPDESTSLWRVVVQEFDSPAWTLHEVSFSDWLLDYLKGRDVTLCSHNFATDGPSWEFLP